LDAILAGTVTIEHTRAIGRQLRHLPDYGSADEVEAAAYVTSCAEVLKVVVPFASTHTPGECGKKAAILVIAADPAGARKRRRKAAERDHGVFLNPFEPSTSEIRAVMPTAYAEALHGAVKTRAKDDRFEVSDGCITAGQRQAAALVALTLGDPGSVAEVTGPVHDAKLAVHVVIVPLGTIVGASEQGGRIGRTPVTADEVRDLLAAAALESSTIRRLVTDSAGCILDAGRKHYLASDLQKLVIRLRDQHCRFPGCGRDAERCEIDHVIPWKSPVARRIWMTSGPCASTTTSRRPPATGRSSPATETAPAPGDHHSAGSTNTPHPTSCRRAHHDHHDHPDHPTTRPRSDGAAAQWSPGLRSRHDDVGVRDRTAAGACDEADPRHLGRRRLGAGPGSPRSEQRAARRLLQAPDRRTLTWRSSRSGSRRSA
jgi:hypothetical protein